MNVASAAPSPIRPVNPQRDLGVIADLIETCFADQMDDEGRAYVRQIRAAAQEGIFSRFLQGANERISLPLGGYVWVEDGRVVGNLTMIPFWRGGRWRYLIANVAVHPNFRQRGIGRSLTSKAIEHIRQHQAEAWLQVRDDNWNAIHLYESLQFVEKARRSTWDASGASVPVYTSRMISAGRRPADWPLQSAWLKATYPPEVGWNLGFHLERMAPGVWQTFKNFIFETPITQWAVYLGDILAGTASWDPGPGMNENLWLAADPHREEEAVFALLVQARRRLANRRVISVNYPAGQADIAFKEAGFVRQNTLIWMKHNQPQILV